MIGHQIADADIDFVPDRTDDRDRRVSDGRGHDLLVERPQILQTSPPRPTIATSTSGSKRKSLIPRAIRSAAPSPARGRHNDNIRSWPSAAGSPAACRGPQPLVDWSPERSAAGCGARAACVQRRTALSSQLLPHLPERQLQRPDSMRHQFVDHQLIGPARRVEIKSADRDHLQPVLSWNFSPRAVSRHSTALSWAV